MNIKPHLAIARVFASIIYADGYLSQQELEYWEDILKPRYRINDPEFGQLNRCTYAQAVQTILASQGRKWLEECQLSALSIVGDMEQLARCDKQITPKEALVCLCTRLAFEHNGCTIISFKNDNLCFSKSDILYVEQTIDTEINNEINGQYDNIRYIMQNFGFNFIDIPKVQEEFHLYSDSYRKHLLQFLYPENKRQEDLDNLILSRLPSANTAGFVSMLFEPLLPDISFSPSLLIKLPTNHLLNPEGKEDFALLQIQGGIMQTIQTFFYKYNASVGRNSIQIQNGSMGNAFLYRGFHKTFIEYLRNTVTDIQIHLSTKKIIRFGGLGELPLPKRLMATYITLLYFAIKQKPFCKDYNRLDEQYAVFNKIYKVFNVHNEYEKEEFYTNMQIDYGKIIGQYFGKLPHKCLLNMAPIYNRVEQVITFRFLPPVQLVTYFNPICPKYQSLTDWVEGLKE